MGQTGKRRTVVDESVDLRIGAQRTAIEMIPVASVP